MKSFDILSTNGAIPHRLFIEASAGTGKTFLIEHLIVRLLIETELSLDEIVVVTFTRAATQELKERIRENLEGALRGASSFSYLKKMKEDQKLKIKRALDSFDNAPISTIHAFCYQIAAQFSSAIRGVDKKDLKKLVWNVLEFLRKEEMLSMAQFSRLLRFYRKDLQKIVQKLIEKNLLYTKEDSFKDLLDRLNNSIGSLKSFSLLNDFSRLRMSYKGLSSSRYAYQISLIQKALDKGFFSSEEFDKLIDAPDLFLAYITPENLKKNAFSIDHPEIEQLKAIMVPIVQQARNPLMIFRSLSFHWGKYVQKLSLPDPNIDEGIGSVYRNLNNDDFVSWVRKKYRAIIVDEFQDTDPIQWKIIEKLFYESSDKSIYLVGDPKQSIYRFRGADVYTFFQAREQFEELVSLTTNYRSTRSLLDDLNALLSAVSWMELPKMNQYLTVPHLESAKEGEGGLYFVCGTEEYHEDGESYEKKSFFPFIVDEINRSKLDLNKTAILVRNHYEALSVKKHLDSCKLPCRLYRDRGLGRSTAISLLKEAIQAINGKVESIHKTLIGKFYKLSLEEISSENLEDAYQLFANLKMVWRDRGFASCISSFFHAPICQRRLIDTLLIEENQALYGDLTEILGRLIFMNEPLEIMLTLEEIGTYETADRITPPTGGIEILTIHASKGLEFENVFLLGLNSSAFHSKDLVEDLEELYAEKMRQLYVAFTRAKVRLYIPFFRRVSSCRSAPCSLIEMFSEKIALDLTRFKTIELKESVSELPSYPV